MRRHDEDDFVRFVEAASPRLLKAAWFLCGDPHRAEDLVQAALEKVYLRWGRLRDDEPLAYARRCLFTQQADEGRRARREVLTDEPPDRAAPGASPGSVDEVVALLRTLPARERQVVVMRHYADLPEAEVAEVLGVSVGTVKSCASRGLAKLRAAHVVADPDVVRAPGDAEEESCRA
jgi:RNA polymerase sigma-70 factor (sigma-E family)